ncbi:MAG: amino acid ABC transporter substrate-binding protein [Marinovum algicola]|uniref:General L-amino acid transport system substrate-binding protein n=1 Tax=Marinovum algicola TaxID=42444 RepID=A0A975ZMA8_9RHOB|nr:MULTISPECIES: amino acid ABC transporter substrate-binding protein [Marinovum]AKO96353.1 ABC-type amino acid transport/signal transduction system, periplasmic component/domain protein [Marinovum algicola DG 898]MDD9738833.1 amino acid ABC transporter substrate-binding protein [Marinovum sp. SP66]MDD9743322.1 amino acid ABC transporter substrate-binding protein [Marinovum sp. PR37]SEI90227.1 general L-amino acid transport system substrate-binding protein [Marinovum algicola]SLN12817.1 Genera
MSKFLAAGAIVAASLAAPQMAAAQSETVKQIEERGTLLCSGHNGSYFGFVEVNDNNEWKGLDIDLCRALTTAILGDPTKNQIVPLSWAQRFPALQSGDVDVIIKATGWTMGRDTEQGLQFSLPYFFGGAQLMAHGDLGVTEASGLAGGTICVEAGTTIERLVANYLNTENIEHNMVSYESAAELRSAYLANRCDAFAAWGPFLAVLRATEIDNPDAHVILDDQLSAEPIAAAMRQGDENFVDVVNWMLAALLIAEEEGVTSENVEEMAATPPNPRVARLLGAEPGIGERLGMRDSWAREMIAAVGNFGEIYDRNLGKDSPYKLERGLNNLWSHGGVLYAPILD